MTYEYRQNPWEQFTDDEQEALAKVLGATRNDDPVLVELKALFGRAVEGKETVAT